MVCLRMHASSAIRLNNTDLQVHGFVGCRGDLTFGLFQHDLEKTLHSWCELNHVILIVIHCEHICDMEFT